MRATGKLAAAGLAAALAGCEADVQIHRTPPFGWGPVVTCPAVAAQMPCPPARVIVPESPELAPIPPPAPAPRPVPAPDPIPAVPPPAAEAVPLPDPAPQPATSGRVSADLEIDVRAVPTPRTPQAPPPLGPEATPPPPPPLTPAESPDPTSRWVPVPRLPSSPRPQA